jgi:hypothetical protein
MAIHDAWSVYEHLSGKDRRRLNEAQRWIAAICDLRQEVNSGGFDSYFRYWGGDSAREALRALPVILDDDWARLLRDAVSLFGGEYPSRADARAEVLDARDLDDHLQALDDRFYRLEAGVNADSLMATFIGRHPEAMA